ncbi:MAG: class I SAM-dependent methyltransferase [Candidatus Verstraetearchaeota archaeon]|nr:class I SAM-dependent methyltransferase [Candidatus Verstraetearchaeota archaeon]
MVDEGHEFKWDENRREKFWNVWASIPIFHTAHFSENYFQIPMNVFRPYFEGKLSILDVGFASGKILIDLSKMGHDCYGIDASTKTVSEFKKRVVMEKVNVEADVGNVTRMPYADEKFDRVFTMELFEHLFDHEVRDGFKEINRVLKRSGLLLMTSPYAEDLEAHKVLCPECYAVFHPVQHIQSFNEGKMQKLLTDSGFKTIVLKKTWIYATPRHWIQATYLRTRRFVSDLFDLKPNEMIIVAKKER